MALVSATIRAVAWLIALTAGCSVVAAGTTNPAPADPGKACPSDAVVMVCVRGPGPFRQNLLDSAIYRAVKASPAVDGQVKRLSSAVELAVAMCAGVPVWKWVDQNVDQIVLLGCAESSSGSAGGFGWALLLDVGRCGARVDRFLTERVRPRLKALTPGGGSPGRNVAGVLIEAYRPAGLQRMHMARARRWLVLGTSGAVAATVKTIQGQAKSLADLPAYGKLHRGPVNSSDASVSFYLSPGLSGGNTPSRKTDSGRAYLLRLLGLGCVGGVAGAFRLDQGRVDASVFVATASPPSGLLGMLEASPPSTLAGAAFVPGDYHALVVANPGSGEQLVGNFWSMIAPDAPLVAGSLQQFNGSAGQFGVNFRRDIISRTVGDWFLATMIPPPDQLAQGFSRELLLAMDPVLGVKVRQPGQIMRAWNMLATAGMVAAQGVKWEAERVGDQDVHVLRAHGKPILDAEFSMAFVGDTWLMTLSFETMKRVLAARRARATLAHRAKYLSVRKRLRGQAVAMVYADLSHTPAPTTGKVDPTPPTRIAGRKPAIGAIGSGLASGEVIRALLENIRVGLTLTGREDGILLRLNLSDDGPG